MNIFWLKPLKELKIWRDYTLKEKLELVDKIDFDGAAVNSGEINGLTSGVDKGVNNGTAIWDMLSKDNLEIAYGIYLYHIDAPGIGQKTGTFAIIK